MSNDFIVSTHALDRFEERFPDEWSSADEVGLIIYGEVIDALAAGREARIAPLQLANYDQRKWRDRNNTFVWTPGKERGYALVETPEGMVVITVLVGDDLDSARRRVYGDKRPRLRRRKENPRDSQDRTNGGPPGLG